VQQYQNVIQDKFGNVIVGASVAVYVYGTTTPATIYSGNGSGVLPSNTVTTNSLGEFAFYAANGRYSLSVSATNFVAENFTDFIMYDPADIGAVTASGVAFTPFGTIVATNVQNAVQEVVADLAGASGSSLVGFLQSGTGAVARTVQAKERDVVSVKDFGATGDGTTDDTAAVQAFIVACQNRRGIIPAGVYKITSTLTLLPQYSYNIEGEVYDNSGATGTVIYNAGTGNAITLDNEPFTQNYDQQIRLANLSVKGNASSLNGIYVRHCMIFLENVWCTANGTNGLYLERAYSSSFRQVVCANNNQNGMLINRAGNALHFDHCIFNGNGASNGYAGAYVSGFSGGSENYGVLFTACDFTGNGVGGGVTVGYGIIVQYSRAVSLIACYAEANKSSNLYSDSTVQNLTVANCYFQDANSTMTGINGLVYENNHHQYLTASTQINVAGGLPGSRLQVRMFGNTYTGGATSNPTAGVTENLSLWYTGVPSGGTWKRGDIIWNANLQNGGGNLGWVCITAGTPGTWLTIGQIPYLYANVGDADLTLTPFSSFTTNCWQSPITANRTVTLSTTNAVSGLKFRVVRGAAATGAFNLNVGTGPLKSLAAGQWCDVEYDGTVWRLTAAGSL
jgi:hypothetical protein